MNKQKRKLKSNKTTARDISRAELQLSIKEFFDRGGKITQLSNFSASNINLPIVDNEEFLNFFEDQTTVGTFKFGEIWRTF